METETGLIMETGLSIKDILTLCISVIALILSIINIRHIMWRDKIKLRVSPGLAIDPMHDTGGAVLSVSVVNLSYLPVTLSGVDLFLGNTKENRITFRDVIQQLPIRIEPRSSESVIFPSMRKEAKEDPRLAQVTHIIASTACGYKKKIKFNPSFFISD